MALKKINYNGQSKIILRLCEMVNQLIDGGGGGGSTVAYTQTLQSGTKTGEISIDGVSTDMYAPTQPIKLSDLQNDTNFIDNTVNNLTNYYLKSETYTQAETDALLNDKVDKVAGKQLSTEDFTSALKTKLEGIASGAEVNVQSDWNQSDSSADDFIKNKPTIPTVNNGTLTIKKGSTTLGTFTANQSGNSEVVIPESSIDINTETPTFTEAPARANIASGETISTLFGKIKKFFTDLKTVAFSGSYNDLDDKPTIPDISTKVSKSGDTMTGDLTLDKQGTVLKIRASGSRYTNITSSASGSNKDIVLPNKSGTLALTSDIPTISFNGTLGSGQNVLTVAKNMPNNSIAYYKNSNKPTNRPTNGDYGAYEFIKSDNMTMIKYISGSMTACAYGIENSATSITWHIS